MNLIINQAWEDVADDVTGAIEKAVQPLLKRAVDDIYTGLLESTQDYLTSNLAFNIASRIDVAEREASFARQENARLGDNNAELLSSLRHLRAFWKPGSNHDTNEVQHALVAADAAIASATPSISQEGCGRPAISEQNLGQEGE